MRQDQTPPSSSRNNVSGSPYHLTLFLLSPPRPRTQYPAGHVTPTASSKRGFVAHLDFDECPNHQDNGQRGAQKWRVERRGASVKTAMCNKGGRSRQVLGCKNVFNSCCSRQPASAKMNVPMPNDRKEKATLSTEYAVRDFAAGAIHLIMCPSHCPPPKKKHQETRVAA